MIHLFIDCFVIFFFNQKLDFNREEKNEFIFITENLMLKNNTYKTKKTFRKI